MGGGGWEAADTHRVAHRGPGAGAPPDLAPVAVSAQRPPNASLVPPERDPSTGRTISLDHDRKRPDHASSSTPEPSHTAHRSGAPPAGGAAVRSSRGTTGGGRRALLLGAAGAVAVLLVVGGVALAGSHSGGTDPRHRATQPSTSAPTRRNEAAPTDPAADAPAARAAGAGSVSVALTFTGTAPLTLEGAVGRCMLGYGPDGSPSVFGYEATSADRADLGDGFYLTQDVGSDRLAVKLLLPGGPWFGVLPGTVSADHRSVTLDADLPETPGKPEHVTGTITC